MDGKKDCYCATIAGFSVQEELSEQEQEKRKAQEASLAIKRINAALKAKEAQYGN